MPVPVCATCGQPVIATEIVPGVQLQVCPHCRQEWFALGQGLDAQQVSWTAGAPLLENSAADAEWNILRPEEMQEL